MPRASSSLTRAAALGLIGLVAGVLWFAAAAPLLAYWQHTGEAIEDAARLRTRLAAIVSLEADPGVHQEHLDAYRGDFLTGSSEATIGAELQARLRAVVTTNNSELLSAQALPSRKVGSLSVVGLRLQMRGPLDSIQRILHAVETAHPLLFVERAVLRQDPAAMTSPARAGLDAVRLVVDLDITGMRWPAPPAERRP